jgi:DNA replicative helicase MCM subunit Mcm2 (Cdc46/Mcm family)
MAWGGLDNKYNNNELRPQPISYNKKITNEDIEKNIKIFIKSLPRKKANNETGKIEISKITKNNNKMGLNQHNKNDKRQKELDPVSKMWTEIKKFDQNQNQKKNKFILPRN